MEPMDYRKGKKTKLRLSAKRKKCSNISEYNRLKKAHLTKLQSNNETASSSSTGINPCTSDVSKDKMKITRTPIRRLTPTESEILTELVTCHVGIIDSNRTDHATVTRRCQVWDEIAQQFNVRAQTRIPFTGPQLAFLWKLLKPKLTRISPGVVQTEKSESLTEVKHVELIQLRSAPVNNAQYPLAQILEGYDGTNTALKKQITNTTAPTHRYLISLKTKILSELVADHAELINSEETDSFTVFKKSRAWEEIARQYNNKAQGRSLTAKQLAYLWNAIRLKTATLTSISKMNSDMRGELVTPEFVSVDEKHPSFLRAESIALSESGYFKDELIEERSNQIKTEPPESTDTYEIENSPPSLPTVSFLEVRNPVSLATNHTDERRPDNSILNPLAAMATSDTSDGPTLKTQEPWTDEQKNIETLVSEALTKRILRNEMMDGVKKKLYDLKIKIKERKILEMEEISRRNRILFELERKKKELELKMLQEQARMYV